MCFLLHPFFPTLMTAKPSVLLLVLLWDPHINSGQRVYLCDRFI
jgi:hypothetical protein